MTLVWLDGGLLPAAEARIDPADRGFTLGDGVFETLAAPAGQPLHLALHLARLRHGASVLGIDIPHDDATLGRALSEVAAGRDAALRLTVTRGPMARGVLPAGVARPTTLVTAGRLPGPLPPARLIVAASTRRNAFSPLSAIKSLNYGDAILARREAASRGADDAILLNTAGDLAEATASTLLVLLDGQWLTPRVTDGALPGIARARLLQAGVLAEARLTEADAAGAEAACLVNSLGLRAVARIGHIVLSDAHPRVEDLRRCL